MRSARVKTKVVLDRISHSESTLTISLHKCLAQTVAKTCRWAFFRSIKNGQEERKLNFTKLFIKLLSLSDWSLAQVWETSHCGLLVFRRMAERMGLLAHQEEEEQFEREESRYHIYNSVAMVLFVTVFIAFLFCIGVIVLALICYIMPFCDHWSYPA